MRYLITGASGFVAGHLIEAIVNNDAQAEITGIDIHKPDYSFLDEEKKQRVRFIEIDILDFEAVKKALDMSRPRYIIHLASFSSVAYSWQYPTESFKNNSNIFLNLLEAVRLLNSKIRILAIGSSEQYGIVSADCIPLRESQSPNPISPYAVARVAQEYMAAVYAKGFQLDIVNTRSFNHFGARQDTRFVLPGFAKQIVEIRERRQEPVIHAGDVTIVRDFTDVRDVVRAYLVLLQKGSAGEIYNVCSGTGRSIRECVQSMMKIAGIDCEIRVEDKFKRPVDNPIIIGSNKKIKEHTGWTPEIPFETALRHLLAQTS